MLWVVLFLALIGGCVYLVIRTDRKLKAKFEDKFNPSEWDLPRSVELPSELKPQPVIAQAINSSLRYQKKPSVFADTHRRVFNALQQAVSNDYLLLSNVNVADVLSVGTTHNALAAQVAAKNLAVRQFDFVICTKNQLGAVCAIVLGESLEPLLVNACEDAGLPLARFKIQATYDVAVIRASLLKAIGSLEDVADVVTVAEHESGLQIIDEPIKKDGAVKVESPTKHSESGINLELCPNCSSVMLKRKAKNGASAGQLFWICSGYPKCRGMIPIK